MWQKLRLPLLLIALAALVPVSLRFAADQKAVKAAERENNRLTYAQRIRDDGDRLAREGQWEDALARYDQAEPFDRVGAQRSETQRKVAVIKEHLGQVVFDKEFESRGAQP